MGQTRPLLVYFCSFLHDKYSTITINDKSFDGVLGTRTRGSRMVGADESTELWHQQHPSWTVVPNAFKSVVDTKLHLIARVHADPK